MRKLLAPLLVLLALLLPCVTGHAQVYLVTVHGSRKFQNVVKGKQVISSQPVTNATVFKTFGVSTKDYVLSFDTGVDALELIPRGGGAPIVVLGLNNAYTSYDTDPFRETLEFGSSASGNDAAGTDFDSLVGVITVKLSETPDGFNKGVSGTVNGASTKNSPHYLYTISFAGTKVFTPKP